MVFKRRRGGKKAYVASQRVRKREAKKTTEADMAQNYVLKKLTKTVKGLTASEKAWAAFASSLGTWDPIPTIVGISTDASMGGVTVTDMTPVAIGTGVGDRGGASITVRSFQIDYSVRQGQLVSSTSNGFSLAVRVMVICFQKPNGVPGDASQSVIPSYHDVFAIQGPGSGMTRSHLRNQYQPFSHTYRVYYDRLHEFTMNNATTPVSATNIVQHGRIKIRPTKKNAVVTFNTTSGATTDVLENQWIMIAMSDNALAGNVGPPEIIVRGLCIFNQ